MRMFYSTLISYAQDGISDTSSTLKTFLKRRINSRYETVTDKLNTWTQIATRTAPTGTAAGADQQYYANPPSLREIESIVVTIGDFDYPLVSVDSQEEWDILNAQDITSAYPERYFRRTNDYGIWPTPNEDDGTITINYTQRATPLYFENYITGTVTVTENSQTIEFAGGASLTSGAVKAGFYFCLTDSNGEPRGTFYKLNSVTDADTAVLDTYFEEATESAATYIIGQSPEIPEEGHELLGIGAIADFYGLKQSNTKKYTDFNNLFWTGDMAVSPRMASKMEDKDLGGLIGLVAAYRDRDSSPIVERVPVVRDILEFRIPRTISV